MFVDSLGILFRTGALEHLWDFSSKITKNLRRLHKFLGDRDHEVMVLSLLFFFPLWCLHNAKENRTERP
jgi:hypothetical protein